MATAVIENNEVKTLQVLLVEDNPIDARLVTGLLQGACYPECRHASSLAEAMAQLGIGPVDVILLDLNLDDSSGYETFAQVRRASPESAILVLSGSDDEELAGRTVREGAQDYLMKGSFDGKLLLRAIRYALERKASEEALRNSESTLRAIFENSLDAIVICEEKTGRLMEANEAAATLMGMPRAELIGRTLCEFSGEGFRAESERMKICHCGRGKFWLRRHDGTQRLVDYCFKANILPARHLGMMRDITEQQSLEEQLRQSQKMEAVGRLAGSVAHDFNNILGVISGYAELIELRGGDEAIRCKAGKILAATTKASSLTKQLLAFGRKQVVTPKLLRLGDVVADLNSMLATLVGAETEVILRCDQSMGLVHADQGQMEQVILNLVTNAREAMPFGGTITITLDDVENSCGAEDLPAGKYVRLAVSDTGLGIDPEIRSRIFEPFFTTKKTGSGLGLSTVFGIVKQAGGHIAVESSPGHGSTFSVYMPLIAQARGATVRVQNPALGKVSGDETILLVDDEDELRNAAAEYLQDCGYRVLKARAAGEALELAGRFPEQISLLVTDIVLPGGSGRTLVEHIRQAHPETGVLVISGYADDAVTRHGFLSSTCFLQKPFTLQSLGAKIRNILDNGKPRV
jgi:PAS domain S-box-containing protein